MLCVRRVETARMLAVCRVHPKGEGDDYDGLYFKESEMDRLAEGMRGLPILVEHDSQPVGKVLHAYKDPKDKRVYAVFETNTDTFGGCLAGQMVRHGLVGEVSLGHECSVESSADGEQKVVAKIPTELSIVERGAREKTHILGKTAKSTSKNYIKLHSTLGQRTASAPMSAAPTDTTAAPSTTPIAVNNEMVKELLAQVQKLTEAQALQTKENEDLKAQNVAAHEKIELNEAAGKRKREVAIDGSIKDYFKSLMEKYNETLKPHETQLDMMFEGMKGNSEAEPLVQALVCAAAAAKGNVVELEAAYQANKKMKLDLETLQGKITEQETQMFAKKEERVVEKVEAQASAAGVETSGSDKPFASIFRPTSRAPTSMKGAGMKEANPEMFNDLMKSAPMGLGMPKINSFLSMIQAQGK